jgi:hypothetical protein
LSRGFLGDGFSGSQESDFYKSLPNVIGSIGSKESREILGMRGFKIRLFFPNRMHQG